MTARTLVPAALIAFAAACASQPTGGGGAPEQASGAKEAKRAAELEQARLELEIEELEAAAGERAAAVEVAEARREVEEAQLALARFGDYERPSALAEARLGLDQATQSLRENEAELLQMEEMYEAETQLDATGLRTRDLVLERHRKAVEFSRRRLELATQRTSDLEQRELPRKERELSQKLEKAQNALRKSEEGQKKGDLERRLGLTKARQKIEELEREKPQGAGGAKGGSEGEAP